MPPLTPAGHFLLRTPFWFVLILFFGGDFLVHGSVPKYQMAWALTNGVGTDVLLCTISLSQFHKFHSRSKTENSAERRGGTPPFPFDATPPLVISPLALALGSQPILLYILLSNRIE